jgi:hypothetical protein
MDSLFSWFAIMQLTLILCEDGKSVLRNGWAAVLSHVGCYVVLCDCCWSCLPCMM